MTYNAKNYMEQGGERWVVGGEVDVTGKMKIGGVQVLTTAAELNVLDAAPASVTCAAGAEENNSITVTATVKDANGTAAPGAMLCWIASDAAGRTPVATADAVAAGAKGAVVEIVSKEVYLAITDASGVVEIAITEAGDATTYYLAFLLPNGKIAVSGAIAFGA